MYPSSSCQCKVPQMPNLWTYWPYSKSLLSCSSTKSSWQQSYTSSFLLQLWRDGPFPKELPEGCRCKSNPWISLWPSKRCCCLMPLFLLFSCIVKQSVLFINKSRCSQFWYTNVVTCVYGISLWYLHQGTMFFTNYSCDSPFQVIAHDFLENFKYSFHSRRQSTRNKAKLWVIVLFAHLCLWILG